MISAPIPSNERERLRNIREYNILDTLPEEEYDDITRLASIICKTPISLISIVDEKRQWFKSHHGLAVSESPRELAFCAHAINDMNNLLIVEDSRTDIRFHDNPFVTGEPHVIFYAGIPLISPEGFAWGTLCVADNKPNQIDKDQEIALRALSRQVVKLLELRRAKSILEKRQETLEIQKTELTQFAQIAAHDLKSPLNSIISMVELIESKEDAIQDTDIKVYLKRIQESARRLSGLITGILDHSKSELLLSDGKTEVNYNLFIQGIIKLLDPMNNYQFIYTSNDAVMQTNKFALEQIFINIIANAIKYNDKEKVIVEIGFTENIDFYLFYIKDNGRGINKDSLNTIFDIFKIEANKDRFGNKGNGIGLATVKKLVEGQGGKVSVSSTLGEGTTFEFSLEK